MLVKIALGNLRRSLRDYVVYFVTIALGVAVFYAFNTIGAQGEFLSGSASETLLFIADLLHGLTYGLAVVLGFLMVYANNFLVRRRKAEFGLYQILGMTRGQVGLIMAVETLVASLAAFVVGIVLGLFASQLLVFVSAALFNETVKEFRFIVSKDALVTVASCFAVTFVVMLLFNLRTVSRLRLVELVRGGRANESVRLRRPVLSAVALVVSVGLIGWAYQRLLTMGFPVMLGATSGDEGMANLQFLITTAMVTAGTFLLFWALPTVLVKVAEHLQRFYLRDLHMFTVRQVASRINSSSAAMGVTAMVLFLAVTSVTTGMAIATSLNSSLERCNPYTASVNAFYLNAETEHNMAADDGLPSSPATEPVDMLAHYRSLGIDFEAQGARTAQANLYEQAAADGGDSVPGTSLMDITRAAGIGSFWEDLGVGESAAATTFPSLEPLSSYNASRELLGMEPVTLESGHALVTSDLVGSFTDFWDKVVASSPSVTLAGKSYVLDRAVYDKSASLFDSGVGQNTGTIVVPDADVANLSPANSFLQFMVPADKVQAFDDYFYDHALPASALVEQGVGSEKADAANWFMVDGRAVGGLTFQTTFTEQRESSGSLTGLVGYMAVYIGFVLVMSVAAVLAIQMLSGVADSTGRYRLLTELGCPRGLQDRSLLSQVLFYFLLPLALAVAHSAVALTKVGEIVALITPFDIVGATAAGAVVFVVVYGGYMVVCWGLSASTVRRAAIEARR
ncbi:ABC transporter permease [Atopobiaceae bacterium 24-176]